MPFNDRGAAYLAYYAYIDSKISTPIPSDFAGMLRNVPATANGPWTLIWGPAENDGIVLYLARGRDGTLTLAIRGTNIDMDVAGFFDNVLADGLLYFVPWLYPRRNESKLTSSITAGTNEALAKAIAVTDPATDRTLIDFLGSTSIPAGADLIVTGHSLGGALAVVAAAWLADQLPRSTGKTLRTTVCTFAAPTISNQLFAKSSFLNLPYYCYVNQNDVIPKAWADLDGILGMFASPGPSLWETDPALYFLIDGMSSLSKYYTPITPSNPMPFSAPLKATGSWADEALQMHSMQQTYFKQVVGTVGPDLPNAVTLEAQRAVPSRRALV